jgi:hypothetical protein
VSDDEVAAMAIDGGAQVWRELRHRAERQGVAADARVAQRLERRNRRGHCSRACGRSKILIAGICDERLRFLQALKTWPVFGAGWGRRVAEVKSTALKMAADAAKASTMARNK